uniref:Coatomer subunit delta n=1 Tax=Eucampia antarctica TaxID=49252 RepID=A0A7S2WEI6_9STRA|mmetsp:Transcript_27419/g.26281  ORF Transcript_27419/g.26281 Transcript_27419/m.26281 type:complete len:199 (+) Transcript_27419:788-1384(+)
MVHRVPIHTCLEGWKDSEAVVILDKVPVSLMNSIPIIYNYSSGNTYETHKAPSEPEPPRTMAKVIALAKSKNKETFMAGIAAEVNLSLFGGASKSLSSSAAAPPRSTPSTPLTLALEEKIHVSMNREGGVESCEVKGTLTFTANTDAGTTAVVAVNKPPNFTFATHPKVNKVDYDKRGCLALKGGKGFPVNRPVGILR